MHHAKVRVTEYGYPKAYSGLKPLEEQICMLQKKVSHWADIELDVEPALAFARELQASSSLPDGAEGRAAIIAPGIRGDHQHDVALALELFHAMKSTATPEDFDPAAFRLDERTERMLDALCEMQAGPILILPVQFGKRHAKRIDTDVVSGFGDHPEFALDLLSMVSLLITHPERLADYSALGISCPGDEYDYLRTSTFERSLMMLAQAGQIKLRSRPKDYNSTDHGVVTGFLHAA